MNLDLDAVAKLAGYVMVVSGALGVIVAAISLAVAPKIAKAIKGHAETCSVHSRVVTEANALARALAQEASSHAHALAAEARVLSNALATETEARKEGDTRIERMVMEIGHRIDAGFENVNATLIRLAGGHKL